MWKKIISVLFIFILTTFTSFAQLMIETEATPSVLTEPGSTFIITEISFKDSAADWVKMKYTSPSGKTFNIRGLTFADDSSFKQIDANILIASGQELLLTFKSDSNDQIPYLYTSRTGLTGTTEQFIVYDVNSSVLDAVCWTSESPTEKEIDDMGALYDNEGWNSSDVFSCPSSSSVKTGESLVRISPVDTDGKNDWTPKSALSANPPAPVQTEDTAGAEENSDTTVAVEIAVPVSSSIIPLTDLSSSITPLSETISQPANPPPAVLPLIELDTEEQSGQPEKATASAEKTQKKASPPAYDGDLSEHIIISEIMPNPSGADTKSEWIEIQNTGNSAVNLGNWIIDDNEDGSKPYTIPSNVEVAADETILFESKETKISLANGEDEVRLFDFNGRRADEVSYGQAADGVSYSKINITDRNGNILSSDWIWTTDATPGQPNPSYIEITAKITGGPEFISAYFFEAVDSENRALKIIFTEDIIAAPLAKTTFTPGTSLKLLLEPDTKENETFFLKKFEVKETSPPAPVFNPLVPSLIVVFALAGASAFYLLRKKIPWQDIKEPKLKIHDQTPGL